MSDSTTTERQALLDLCGGNLDAVALIDGLWLFVGAYDDAIDGDKKRSDAEIHAAMQWALFGLYDNTFYRQHERALRPALLTMIAEWMVANEIEAKGDPAELETSFTLRCSPFTVFATIAQLATGSIAGGIAAAQVFRRHKRGLDDRLADYVREHAKG